MGIVKYCLQGPRLQLSDLVRSRVWPMQGSHLYPFCPRAHLTRSHITLASSPRGTSIVRTLRILMRMLRLTARYPACLTYIIGQPPLPVVEMLHQRLLHEKLPPNAHLRNQHAGEPLAMAMNWKSLTTYRRLRRPSQSSSNSPLPAVLQNQSKCAASLVSPISTTRRQPSSPHPHPPFHPRPP